MPKNQMAYFENSWSAFKNLPSKQVIFVFVNGSEHSPKCQNMCLVMGNQSSQSSFFHIYEDKLFPIKSTLFGNRRDVVYVWSLTYPIIGCTWTTHRRMCVWETLCCSFKLKWRFVNGYRGVKWRATKSLWTSKA